MVITSLPWSLRNVFQPFRSLPLKSGLKPLSSPAPATLAREARPNAIVRSSIETFLRLIGYDLVLGETGKARHTILFLFWPRRVANARVQLSIATQSPGQTWQAGNAFCRARKPGPSPRPAPR